MCEGVIDKIDPEGSLFQVSLQRVLTCTGDNCTKIYKDPISRVSVIHLSLKLDENQRSIAQLLDDYLSGTEQMPCNVCLPQSEEDKNSKMPPKEILMSKKVYIYECPMFLLVCVNRYHDGGTKIKTKITFSQSLWIELNDGGNQLYRLYSIVEHKGETTNSGHYITYMSSYDLKEPMIYNDHGGSSDPTWNSVSWKKFETAKKNGYIFYYKKAEDRDLNGFLKHYNFENEGLSSDDDHALTDKEKIKRMQKLLSSSEAKRRIKREEHCQMCNRDTGQSVSLFQRHLESSEPCRLSYFRNYHQNNILDLCVIIFACIGCGITKTKNQKIFPLKNHLKKASACLNFYFEAYNVSSLDEVVNIVKNVKKKNRNSRSSAKRKLETEKQFNKLKEAVTIATCLNNFRRDIALSNFHLCVLCKGNFLESGVDVLTHSEAQHMNINLVPLDKRMNRFWLCHDCSNRSIIIGDGNRLSKTTIPIISLDFIDVGEERVFFPTYTRTLSNANLVSNDDNENKILSVMIPSNQDCVKLFESNYSIEADNDLVQRISQSKESLKLDDIQRLFTNIWKKYQNVVLYAQRFFGNISDEENRQLSNIEPLVNDKQIHSSDQWFANLNNDIIHRFDQLGTKAFSVTCQVPQKNIESYATSKLIQNSTITLDYVGNTNNEMKTKYWQHNHMTDIDCPSTCEKTDLSVEFNSFQNRISTKYITSYTNSVFQKLHAFVENIVKNQSFSLHGNDYIFTVSFDKLGNANIEGIIWPIKNDDINIALHEESYSEDVDEEAYLQHQRFVEQNISTSSSAMSLKEQFGIDDTEAIELSDLVKRYQIDLKMNPSLPSLETFYNHGHLENVSKSNIDEAERLTSYLLSLLFTLSDHSKTTLSTKDWLLNINNTVEICWDTSSGLYESVSLKLGDQQFNFLSDKLLLDYVSHYSKPIYNCQFMGYYQFALAIIESSKNQVILRKDEIVNCFTYSYNPVILKAFQSFTNVFPVHGTFTFHNDIESVASLNLGKSIAKCHKKVSLNELVSLNDSRKSRIISNPSVQFVNTNPNCQELFQKVFEETENTYSTEDESGHFEQLFSVLIRHRLRLNGDFLILAEFASWYQFLGNEKSKNILEDINEMEIENIQKSHEISSSITRNQLPAYILSSNGQVSQLRKSPKILSYSKFPPDSDEWKFSRVLLFYPIEPQVELNIENMEKIDAMLKEPFSSASELSIVDRNEKLFLGKNINHNFKKKANLDH